MHSKINQGVLGAIAGATATLAVAVLMGQGAGQPVPDNTYRPGEPTNRTNVRDRSGTEYFVTGDATTAQLWVRDGSSLRWVSRSDANQRATPNGWTKDGNAPHTKDPNTTTPPTPPTNPSSPNNPNPR